MWIPPRRRSTFSLLAVCWSRSSPESASIWLVSSTPLSLPEIGHLNCSAHSPTKTKFSGWIKVIWYLYTLAACPNFGRVRDSTIEAYWSYSTQQFEVRCSRITPPGWPALCDGFHRLDTLSASRPVGVRRNKLQIIKRNSWWAERVLGLKQAV